MKLKDFNKIKDTIIGKEVKVTLHDGKEYIGKYVGTHDIHLAWIGNTAIYVKDIKEINTYTDNKIYKYVLVEYKDLYTNKDYSYKTTWKNIHEGDEVLVDCNGENEIGEVTEIRYCRRKDAPWPPENTKPIIKVYSENLPDDYDDDGVEVDITYDYNETRYCPICGEEEKKKLIRIMYGHPSRDLLKEAEKGEIYLGGCHRTNFDPVFYCKECKNKFFEDLTCEEDMDEVRVPVFEKLKELVSEEDKETIEYLFRNCIHKFDALANINNYLNHHKDDLDINDLYIEIYKQTKETVIKHYIKDEYEYFRDNDREYDILIRLDLEKGEYKLFTIAVTKEGFKELWLLPEEYDPSIYDRTSNYDFNELKELIYQEDIDEYIDKFHKDIEEELERIKTKED